jgi:uncharacterized membrane protein
MNALNKKNVPRTLGDWERVAVFVGIIITVPMLALLGSAIYSALLDRPGAFVGILLSIIIMLIFWAIIWGGIWMFSVFRARNNTQANSARRLEDLERENERLQKLVTQLSEEKQS